MKIEILGMGCKKCADLYDSTKAAIDELQMNAQISKVEDFKEIMKYGVMTTPALVVDGTVKSAGKVLSTEDIKKHLT